MGMPIGKKNTLTEAPEQLKANNSLLAKMQRGDKYQLKLQIGVDKSPEVNYTRTNRKNFLPKGGDKAWLQ